MNGIICINKPQDFTSFDVIAKMRGILKTKRLGHSGTLDPMATGVLVTFAGTATKAADILPCNDKTYEAGFKLGVTTDTQDIWGKVLTWHPVEVSEQDVLGILPEFSGEIMQIPPMYSAVSVGGKRLYDLARQGIEIEREARPVTIHSLSLLSFNKAAAEGKLSISCSKGTYIRTLIHDIGAVLGCGGIMTSLVRTKASGFTLSDCVTLEELQGMNGDFSRIIIPTQKIFAALPQINLSDAQTAMYKNGIKLDISRINFEDKGDRYAVFGGSEFLGTANIIREENLLKIEKNFYER